jgi:methylenetetrahydrofolate reductase (NADPH)
VTRANLLRDCSFEIAARGHARLANVQSQIPKGTVISIAFLAGNTVPILVQAAASVRQLGFTPKPHIAARRLSSGEELAHLLGELRAEANVDRAFVIAGDAPNPLGPYDDALAVINTGLLAEFGIKRVGISGYPDGHPEISDELLWNALLRKSAALARQGHEVELITQFGFDAAAIIRWLGQVRRRDVDAEVRIGIPGPATVKSLLHFAARCGVRASAAALAKYGISLTRLLGTATPDRLLRELAVGISAEAEGQVRLHFHPFGGLDKAVQLARDLGALQASA